MGGRALKNTYTRRYSPDEYGRLVFEVSKKLSTLGIKSRVPKSFGAKGSFGDLDILINAESLKGRKISIIIEDYFLPNEVYDNNHVYSFDYKEFQIDFIIVPDEEWNTAYNYFSYNDLGNLIGRISYQMGFRYGHYGLKLVYRHDDGGKKFNKIISKDMFDILQFLGFDPDKYVDGFHELTEIFDYVIDSRYFNPKIFQYEALNHQNKTRNKKRVNYAGFLEYVDKQDFKGRKFYQYEDKDYYVKKTESYFNINIVTQIEEWNREVENNKLMSAKFNGKVIMERFPHLKGKELGNSIKIFKEYARTYLGVHATAYTIENFSIDIIYRNWIIETDSEHIFTIFKTANNLN